MKSIRSYGGMFERHCKRLFAHAGLTAAGFMLEMWRRLGAERYKWLRSTGKRQGLNFVDYPLEERRQQNKTLRYVYEKLLSKLGIISLAHVRKASQQLLKKRAQARP
ncbi:MAG: hypothetical protein WBQ53_02820 [Methylocystis sp.]